MRGDKKHILIVDDDLGVVHAIERALNTCGSKYVIDIATDGFEGGRKIMDTKPDLVILDIRMPRVDGTSLATAMHNDPGCKDIKILVVSGVAATIGAKELEKIGITEILDKPFDNDALCARVEKLLQG